MSEKVFCCVDCAKAGKFKTHFYGEFQYLQHRAFKHDDWTGLDKWYEKRNKPNPYK